MRKFKILISSLMLVVASTSISAPAQSLSVKTAGQAMSLCRSQAERAHPGYERSKSTQIKKSRGGYKIRLKVNTADDTVLTLCEVSKTGDITYSRN